MESARFFPTTFVMRRILPTLLFLVLVVVPFHLTAPSSIGASAFLVPTATRYHHYSRQTSTTYNYPSFPPLRCPSPCIHHRRSVRRSPRSVVLYAVPPSLKNVSIRIATLAVETAVKWIIPAVAIRYVFSGRFRGNNNNAKRDKDDAELKEAELIAKSITDVQLESYMYDDDLLEDIALGTNLGSFSPNGFRKYQRKGRRGLNDENRGKRPIRRLWDWLWKSGGDDDDEDWLEFGGDAEGGRRMKRNPGLPKQEYMTVELLNERLESYAFSLESATSSRAAAASDLKAKNFGRAYGRAIAKPLSHEEMDRLVKAEAVFLKRSSDALNAIYGLDRAARDLVIQRALQEESDTDGSDGANVVDAVLEEEEEDNKEETNSWFELSKPIEGSSANATTDEPLEGTSGTSINTSTSTDSEQQSIAISEAKSLVLDIETMSSTESAAKDILSKALAEYGKALVQHELDFIENVVKILGKDRAPSLRAALLHTSGPPGRLVTAIRDRPLAVILGELGCTDPAARRKNLFVCDFPGDVRASQVKELREEITGIIRSASPGDEALVVLQSGGGTVTGYGLAAGQLRRLKDAGLRLTICVEEYAASGGYMMCCVADKIVASPFAVLGSIGVITEVPNAYNRLEREGIEFLTVTAGKYKRTLTPTKKPTKEDVDKTKADLEDVLDLFRSFVSENRPSLDLEVCATGETWYGKDALKNGLCDAIGTKDDVLLEYVDKGFDVFGVRYKEPKPFSGLRLFSTDTDSGFGREKRESTILRRLVRSVVSIIKEEVLDTQVQQQGRGQHRMVDPFADRVRVESKL